LIAAMVSRWCDIIGIVGWCAGPKRGTATFDFTGTGQLLLQWCPYWSLACRVIELLLSVPCDASRRSLDVLLFCHGMFSGPQVFGNTNAPPAVTYSAIIYCAPSLLVEEDT
jgi:hypothetical protein